MNNSVVEQLLHHSGLDQSRVQQLLEQILQHQNTYADMYFQSSQHESWVLEDGIIKDGSYNIERGVGVRAINDEKTGFAYSDDINLDALTKACTAARTIAPSGGTVKVAPLEIASNKALYTESNPLLTMQDADKIALLRSVDSYVRQQEPDVSQVVVSLTGVYEEILVAASDGTFATDIRPLIRLNCSVLLEKNGKRERGASGCGGRRTYDFFSDTTDAGIPRYQQLADDALHMARINLEAVPAPAGCDAGRTRQRLAGCAVA